MKFPLYPPTHEQYAELVEELQQLREEFAGEKQPPLSLVFRQLTCEESRILRLLIARPLVSKHVYQLNRAADDHEVDLKVLDVFVCKMRKKLAPLGIKIETRWGQGYYLSPETKAKIKAMCVTSSEAAA